MTAEVRGVEQLKSVGFLVQASGVRNHAALRSSSERLSGASGAMLGQIPLSEAATSTVGINRTETSCPLRIAEFESILEYGRLT